MARKARRTKSKAHPPKIKEKEASDFVGLVGEIVNDLPKGTSPEVIQKITRAISYSGPIPISSEFQKYEDVLPGASDRILKIAEREQSIRSVENKHMLTNDTYKIVGSVLVSVLLIAAGVYCGVVGLPWLGGVLGTSGAVAGIIRAAFKN